MSKSIEKWKNNRVPVKSILGFDRYRYKISTCSIFLIKNKNN